jgi:cell filamentation protein
MSDKYGTGWDAQYCYPGTDVLINKLGVTDEVALETAEIELTQARIEQYEPDFDDISLSTLWAIHFHLFQDIYEWAGQYRTVDISKGSTGSQMLARSSRRRTNCSSSLRKKAISPICRATQVARGYSDLI